MNWYGNGNGMMRDWGYATVGMIIMVLFFFAFVWSFIIFFQHGSKHGHHHEAPHNGAPNLDALNHLNMRLAKGEISPEEFLVIKGHLSQ